jgi:hypothetical protein
MELADTLPASHVWCAKINESSVRYREMDHPLGATLA